MLAIQQQEPPQDGIDEPGAEAVRNEEGVGTAFAQLDGQQMRLAIFHFGFERGQNRLIIGFRLLFCETREQGPMTRAGEHDAYTLVQSLYTRQKPHTGPFGDCKLAEDDERSAKRALSSEGHSARR